MAVRRCLICERSGIWATALRALWPPNGPRIVETRSWSDLLQALVEAPESLVCLEATEATPDEVVRRLALLHRDFPDARAIVLAIAPAVECETLWRECGAIEVASSPRDLTAATRLAARHCWRGTEREQTLRDELWRRIPWADAAATATANHHST